MKDDSTQPGWQKQARHVARKINLGWWLQSIRVPVVVATLILSCGILLARREIAEFPWLPVSLAAAGIVLLVLLVSWLVVRRQFETPDEALVRVEASMKLRNALSAAKAGVAPWPALPKTVDDGTRWHWPRLLTPLFAAILFLSLSILLPVTARTNGPTAPDEPQAWQELDAEIEELRENDAVQEEYLDELEERIEKLREQKKDEWFSHSSMEATDNLNRAHATELEQLRRKLRQAERSLNALQQNGTKLSDGARERLLDEFQKAVDGMGEGAMKPNTELLEQLQGLNPENLGNLTPEQMDALRENMRQHAEQMNGDGQGQGEGQGQGQGDWIDDLLNEGGDQGPGQGNGPGEGPEGPGTGNGGLNRGPGSDPNVLGNPSAELEAGEREGLKSRDLSRTLPGDLLQLMDGEHEVREEDLGIREGGSVAEEGLGGDRVWKDSLLPDEKKALKQFFK